MCDYTAKNGWLLIAVAVLSITLVGCGDTSALTIAEYLGYDDEQELVTFDPPPGTYIDSLDVTVDVAEGVLAPGENSLYYEYLLISADERPAGGVPLDYAVRAPVTLEVTTTVTIRAVALAIPYDDRVNQTYENEHLSSEYSAQYVIE